MGNPDITQQELARITTSRELGMLVEEKYGTVKIYSNSFLAREGSLRKTPEMFDKFLQTPQGAQMTREAREAGVDTEAVQADARRLVERVAAKHPAMHWYPQLD